MCRVIAVRASEVSVEGGSIYSYGNMFCSYCDTRSDIVERNKS